MFDTIIIGGGCAGLSAAMYAGRLKLKTLVLEGQRGGTLSWAGDIDNYPGYKNIPGTELVEKMREHALEYGPEIMGDFAQKIIKTNEGYIVNTREKEYPTKTVIIATGTAVRKLGIPGEKEYTGKGVHYCALCDGFFYKNKTVAIIGGSDSAAKEALILTQWAKKVFIIYRGEHIRAEPINDKLVAENAKIEVINNTNLTKIIGAAKVQKVELDKEYNGKKELELDGIFMAIGHTPITAIAKELGVQLNEKNEIIISRDSKTNLIGVFAAGDVVDTPFKQAITGAAEGVMAAYSAYKFIKTSAS